MEKIIENINPISVEIEPKFSVTLQAGATVEVESPEYSVHVQRKEYKVVGDNIYIPRLYDDAPQWMKDIIGTVVDIKTAVAVGNLNDALDALRTLATELEVAKNTYTMSIISSNDIDERITTAIETLNSSLTDADATILNIAQTAVTPSEASAIAINTLSASLSASGEIGSFISSMNSAFADLESTTAQNIQYIESAIESEFSANATAVQTIKTYVGIDDNGGKTGTGLLADIEIIQKQNDGIIETTTGTYDVMLNPQDPDTAQLVVSAEPYASWKAADITGIDTRLAHIGDVYIQYVSNTNGSKDYVASYKFIRTITDTTSPYATDTDGFTWALIIDQAAQDAYQQALNAYDLADGKRRVFVDTPYVPYDEGDLWVRVVSGSNQIWRCNTSSLSVYNVAHWQLASTDDMAAVAIATGQVQIDISGYDFDASGWGSVVSSSKYSDDLNLIDSKFVQTELDIANMDNRIDSEEASRIQALMAQQSALLAEQSLRIQNDAALDGLITSEEQARIDAINDIEVAYKEYNRVVALAIADGVLTPEEQIMIANAQSAVDAAKARFQSLEDGLSYIEEDLANQLSKLSTLEETNDGVVNTFYESTAPTSGMSYGDWWVDSDSVPMVAYRYQDINGKNVGTLAWRNESNSILGKSYITAYDAKNSSTSALANAATAQLTANNASSNATAALSKIDDIASDNILSPVEKPTIVSNYAVIIDEQIGIDAQASVYGITTEKTAYDTSISQLTSYLSTLTSPVLWNNLTGNTTIVGATFRSKFNSVYIARQTLLNKITDRAKQIADASALTATWTGVASRPTSLSALNSTDGATLANAKSAIEDIASDSKFTPVEKSSVRKEFTTIVNEKAKVIEAATTVGVSSSIYLASIVSLGTYLNNGVAWAFSTTVVPSWINDANLSVTTDIVSATFRTKFNDYYVARQELITNVTNAINTLTKTKTVTFYQTGIPTSLAIGDLWIDTDNNNKTYIARIAGANEIKAGEWEVATDTSALSDYVSIFSDSISEIETQLDGVGVTYFQTERPYLATAGTSVNNGDIWFDTNRTPNYAERFSYINGVGSWNSITNSSTLSALKVASDTKAAADGVIHTFVQTTEPTLNVGLGDIWFNSNTTAGAKEIYTYVGTGGSNYSGRWNKVGTFINTTVNLDISQALVGTKNIATYVADEIDKEVVVYSGTASERSALTGMKLNDIFIEKTTETGASGVVVDVINTYKYSGTSWVKIGNNNNLTALADLADGKRTIFSNNTSMPSNPKIRDMWIPSGNYLTYTQGEVYLYNGTAWVVATRYTADIATLSSNIQSQIDGKVDTYYQATVPFANATNVARRTSAGDYWYCTSTAGAYVKGKMYKYVESANGSNWNYTWTETADITKYAFDTADSKAAIYTTSSKPSTYNVRDMLIVITDNAVPGYSAGVMLTSTVTRTSGGFTNADWTKLVNDTEDLDDFVNSVYTPTINSLQTQVDAKIEYWFQSTDPKSAWTTAEERLKHNGDVWYNTTTKVSQYYSSQTNSWNIISDKDALDAIAAAEAARQLADSKVVVRYGTAALRDSTSAGWTAAEKTSNIGDIWIISDAGVDQYKQFRWTGTAWLDVRDKKIIANAEAITQLGVDITSEAGLRIAGDTAVTNTVKAYADGVGAGIETKWAYDSVVNIGGVYKKSGFGLTTNYTSGAGTEANPYVSEFWIDASRLKFTNSNMTGQVAPFTIDATGITPEITFNGKVSFTNVTGYTPPDVSGDINTNNDTFAQGLGYTNYNAMVSDAQLGKTLISGGYINTGLVNADSIVANSVSSDKISSYNLTSTNATIQNGLITNAKIADASITTAKIVDGNITNVKIGDAQITTAKIGDAQITNAKIGALSVDTFKIQNEAVIVPRSASGTTSCTIVYTPTISHNVAILSACGAVIRANSSDYHSVTINNVIEQIVTGSSILVLKYLNAGTTYTITAESDGYGTNSTKLLMLGVKK